MAYENSIFPIDIIRITQLSHVGSHVGSHSMDFIGTRINYPVVAPYKCKITSVGSRAFGNTVFYVSCDDKGNIIPVRTPTGNKILTTSFTHSDMSNSWFVNHMNKGTIFNRGDFIYETGNTGASSGDHVHINVGVGYSDNLVQNSAGVWVVPNEIAIKDAFYFLNGFNYYSFINGLTIDLVKIDDGEIRPPVKPPGGKGGKYGYFTVQRGNKRVIVPIRKRR